jgi:hypothetical protein
MTALAVIEHLNIRKDRCLDCLVCVIVLRIDQCSLSGVKEALRYGVIPTVALPTHTRLYPMLAQELPRAVRALLTATVGMHDQARGGLASAKRH